MGNWLTFLLLLCALVFIGLIIAMFALIAVFILRQVFGKGSWARGEDQKLFEKLRLLNNWAKRVWLIAFSLMIATVIGAVIVGLWKAHLH